MSTTIRKKKKKHKEDREKDRMGIEIEGIKIKRSKGSKMGRKGGSSVFRKDSERGMVRYTPGLKPNLNSSKASKWKGKEKKMRYDFSNEEKGDVWDSRWNEGGKVMTGEGKEGGTGGGDDDVCW